MAIHYVLFDLDETLYTDTTGLFKEVARRIDVWLIRVLGLSPEAARALHREYYLAYGTTMSGLLRHHPELDIDDYLDYVHQIDVSRYLDPQPDLAEMLTRLPVDKVIFTNAIANWAERILCQLGVRQHFSSIIDVRTTQYMGKPDPSAYEQTLDILDAQGSACVFVEDQPRNLQQAAELGMRTLLVRPGGEAGEGIDFAVDHILEAGPVLHHLLDA